MLVTAIFIAVMGIFGFVAAMEVPINLVVDVETYGVFGVEERLVAEDESIGRVLHFGLGAELQVCVGVSAEAVADAQVVVVAAAGRIDL